MPTPRSAAPRTKVVKETVDFNLDTLEVEIAEPWVVQIGGQPVHFLSIQDLDWQVIADFDERYPKRSIDAILDPADREHFYSQKISARKLGELFTLYLDHFDVRPGEFDA